MVGFYCLLECFAERAADVAHMTFHRTGVSKQAYDIGGMRDVRHDCNQDGNDHGCDQRFPCPSTRSGLCMFLALNLRLEVLPFSGWVKAVWSSLVEDFKKKIQSAIDGFSRCCSVFEGTVD